MTVNYKKQTVFLFIFLVIIIAKVLTYKLSYYSNL